MKPTVFILSILLAGLFLAFGSFYWAGGETLSQTAEDGQAIFQAKCSSCHTVGGGQLVGPDLAGVTTRRDLNWIKGFIADPGGMIAAGDPTATELLAQFNNVAMPSMGLSSAEIDSVVAYLETAASTETSAEPAPAPAVLVGGSPANGHRLFTGEMALANGGTPCIACHTVGGMSTLQGGTLGPDLTHVFQRYGEAGLVAALDQIAFPSMQGAFGTRPLLRQEQADLVAYFREADTTAPPANPWLTWIYLGVGTAGAALLFGLLAIFWSPQRRSLAETLRAKSRGEPGPWE